MSDYVKTLIEDLFLANEEQKEKLANLNVDAVVENIMTALAEKKEEHKKEYAHIFICKDKETAQKVNVFPDTCATTIDNMVILKNFDAFYEAAGHPFVMISGQKYNIPIEYLYNLAFVG